MWMTILGFLGGPVVKGLIDAYQAKLKAGNVESRIAALGLRSRFKVYSDKIATPGDGLIIFRGMQYDAGKYRLMMKARDAATARPLPPVQRPGMAALPAERAQADLRALSSRLSSSGDIKDAVALYNARKSGRR